jgi:hypothetical protein
VEREMAKTLSPLEQKLETFFRQHNATHALRLAVKRMAGPATERLRWVVEFARRDLDLLQPGEREALGFDLRGLVVHSLGAEPGYRMSRTAMPDVDLRRYQARIADGLRGLLSDRPQEWPTPEVRPRVVVTETTPSGRRRFAVRLGGDEAASILGGVANLIAEAGEHLRTCLNPDCKKVFVAQAKQARYCGASCSQSVRDKRRGEESANG